MKFNTTYTSKISKIDTIKEITFIKNKVIDYFNNKYDLININSPIYYNEDNPLIMNAKRITRKVTFDISSEYRVASLSLSPTNWLRKFLSENKFQVNHGLWTETTSVWRDVKETPTSAIQRNEITFMFVTDKDVNKKQLNTITQEFYAFIYKLANQLKNKYELLNEYPYFAEYLSAQQLDNLMPNQDFHSRETEIINEKDAFILTRPGAKLFSGKIHSNIPPTHYDLQLFNQIVLKDFINSDTLKIASVGVIATGSILKEQAKKYLMQDSLASSFLTNQLNYTKNKMIEIKVNIDRLCMGLLQKGHIAEVLSGVFNKESSIINKKHKIPIL